MCKAAHRSLWAAFIFPFSPWDKGAPRRRGPDEEHYDVRGRHPRLPGAMPRAEQELCRARHHRQCEEHASGASGACPREGGDEATPSSLDFIITISYSVEVTIWV